MRSRCDANRPWSAAVVVNLEQVQVAVETLNASVLTVRDVDVALRIGCDGVRCVQLPGLSSARPDGFDEPAVLVVLHNARVRVAVSHEDIAGQIPGDICG